MNNLKRQINLNLPSELHEKLMNIVENNSEIESLSHLIRIAIVRLLEDSNSGVRV